MSRYCINLRWDEAPHLSDTEKAELLSSIPEYQRKARSQGIPILGSGVIYPFDEEHIKVEPFEIPKHWPRCFGGDTDAGAGWTAFVWLAWDRDGDMVYLTHNYKSNSRSLSDHVDALKAKGTKQQPLWIPGVADAAGLLVTAEDSMRVIELYRERGVDVDLPDKTVEAGIQNVYDLLNARKLKVFSSCSEFFAEFRMYHRKDGKVVKSNDHVMDACLSGDTQVVTRGGLRTLRSLVGEPTTVLTRSGAWAQSCGARLTIEQSPTVKLTFTNGYSVVCTPDHPFLTPHGWVRADRMLRDTCYNGLVQREQWHLGFQRHIKSFKAFVITCAATITNAMAFVSTALCGNMPIANMCRTGCTSITSMAMPPITIRQILRSCLVPNTSACIKQESVSRYQWQLARPPRNGMGQMKDWRGIVLTIRQQRPLFTSTDKLSASNAGTLLTIWGSMAETDSVQTPAKVPFVVRLWWTIRNVCAWRVVQRLWLIVTRKHGTARADALIQCQQVEPAPPSDVYCLTVPGAESFCLANGAVVHNTRYAIRSGLERAKVMPVEKIETIQSYVYNQGSQHTGWMGS